MIDKRIKVEHLTRPWARGPANYLRGAPSADKCQPDLADGRRADNAVTGDNGQPPCFKEARSRKRGKHKRLRSNGQPTTAKTLKNLMNKTEVGARRVAGGAGTQSEVEAKGAPGPEPRRDSKH